MSRTPLPQRLRAVGLRLGFSLTPQASVARRKLTSPELIAEQDADLGARLRFLIFSLA